MTLRAVSRTVTLLAGLSLASVPGAVRAAEPDAPVVLVEWASAASAERLARSARKVDFFPLSNHFVSQDNKLFCGLASSAMVLNALRLGKVAGLPRDEGSVAADERAWLPEGFTPFFGKYTPNNVLRSGTKDRAEVLGRPVEIGGERKPDYGLELHELAQVLRTHGLAVTVRVVDGDADADRIRSEIAANLAARDDYVLVNYARDALGQPGGGHISPLGAYDERSDSFLLMDVNPNAAPWVWVRSDDLVAAMRTFDMVENRGYLLVSEPADAADAPEGEGGALLQ